MRDLMRRQGLRIARDLGEHVGRQTLEAIRPSDIPGLFKAELLSEDDVVRAGNLMPKDAAAKLMKELRGGK